MILSDTVHIGSDEYWGQNASDAFYQFAEDIYNTVTENGKTRVRMWGSFDSMGVTPKPGDEDKYELDLWFAGYENPTVRSAQGFKIISMQDSAVYGNPGRDFRDVVNAEFIFEAWDPTMFGTGNSSRLLFKGDPNLIGAKSALWGEETHKGYIERDVNQRVLRCIAPIVEKSWGGTRPEDKFETFELAATKLAEGPGTQIAMKVDSKSSLVLNYDFTNISEDKTTVYDVSGNGYDAKLTGGAVSEDGWLTFDGNTLVETAIQTLSYPYTVSFDVKLTKDEAVKNLASTAVDDPDRTDDAAIFSGYDGRLLAMDATHNGDLTGEVNYFTRDFGYSIPEDGTPVNITLVGTFQASRLYVDGKLVKFLSRTEDGDRKSVV